MKVVFMGTPGFAVPPLLRLVADGHDVAGVVTQPDRPSGRGREVTSPPVKQSALEKGLKILQPENVNSEESVREITSLAPELIVVVAFGAILRRPLLELPSRGCINLHASLLPRLRGVAPVNWAIVRGEKTTGVTTMWMNEQVDAGEIVFQQETPIMPEETAGELEERLSRLGSDLLSETLRAVEQGTAPRVPQDIALKSYAPKLKKEDGKIDWTRDSATLHDHIRGMTPWPGAQTTVGGQPVKVLKARVHSLAGEHTPGSVLGVSESGGIEVAAGRGSIAVLVIQPAAKKPMAAADFARGRRLSERDRFGT